MSGRERATIFAVVELEEKRRAAHEVAREDVVNTKQQVLAADLDQLRREVL